MKSCKTHLNNPQARKKGEERERRNNNRRRKKGEERPRRWHNRSGRLRRSWSRESGREGERRGRETAPQQRKWEPRGGGMIVAHHDERPRERKDKAVGGKDRGGKGVKDRRDVMEQGDELTIKLLQVHRIEQVEY